MGVTAELHRSKTRSMIDSQKMTGDDCSAASARLACRMESGAYRRLFLRRYRAPHLTEEVWVDVEILVCLDASDSKLDEIRDVVDYNVMRDTLIEIRPDASVQACRDVTDALVKVPGIAAAAMSISHIVGQVCTASSLSITCLIS